MFPRTPGFARPSWRKVGAPLATSGGYEQFIRSDLYVCAGVYLAAGFGDNTSQAECQGDGGATAGFEPYIIAIPEVAWATGTITSIGFYAEGGAGGFRAWAGVARNATTAGITYPTSIRGIFEHPGAGFDGERFRAGAIAVPVVKGEPIWVLTQTNGPNQQRGYRHSSSFRTCLGENTPQPLTAAGSVGYMGLRTAAVAAYNASLAAFPAGAVLLPVGVAAPIGPGSGNSSNRPSTYIQLTPS